MYFQKPSTKQYKRNNTNESNSNRSSPTQFVFPSLSTPTSASSSFVAPISEIRQQPNNVVTAASIQLASPPSASNSLNNNNNNTSPSLQHQTPSLNVSPKPAISSETNVLTPTNLGLVNASILNSLSASPQGSGGAATNASQFTSSSPTTNLSSLRRLPTPASNFTKNFGSFAGRNNNASNPENFIFSQFELQKLRYQQSFLALDTDKKGFVTLRDVALGVSRLGLDPNKHAETRSALQELIPNQLTAAATSTGSNSINSIKISFEDFFKVVSQDNILHRAFTGKLAVPNWEEFCQEIRTIFEQVRSNRDGKNAEYIPQLAEQDPELFGLSICTIDGQKFHIGDYDHDFTLQSCGKPFSYCIACEDIGVEEVHEHVGYEPSGVSFNAFTLDDRNKPHNPMINSGSIVVCSLLKPEESASKRFLYVQKRFSEFAGGAKIGFDNSVFLSEKDTADRNFALTYYMHEHQVFPKGTKLDETMDLYFQTCSILVDCDKLAVMAATLANAGVNPLTEKRIVSPETVKCVLQLMYSCGMYEFSGEWSCSVGLPSKSGVAGAVAVVIPSVLGMCIFSPRLDKRGNSVRGVDFGIRASKKFKWSIFDQIVADDDEDEEEPQQQLQQQQQQQQQQHDNTMQMDRAPAHFLDGIPLVQQQTDFKVEESNSKNKRQFGQLLNDSFISSASAFSSSKRQRQ